jgi:hypothetical protein
MPDSQPPRESGPGSQKPAAGRDPDRVTRQQVRGLILLAVLLAFFALMRANWHALFAPGWWRIF